MGRQVIYKNPNDDELVAIDMQGLSLGEYEHINKEMLIKGYQPLLTVKPYMTNELITREQALRNIAEWLFVNEQPLMKMNKQKWREELLKVIEWNISKMK